MRNLPLYEQIASRIEGQIRTGTLRPGDRVPSVRRLSQLENVSVSTVLEAYLYLERRELIEARPQSGFYVRGSGHPLLPEPSVPEAPPAECDVKIADLVARTVEAPAEVPIGTYEVEIKLFANGALVTKTETAFEIVKVGFEQFVATTARQNGLIYGLVTAAMALMSGWAASIVFRKD